MCSHTEQDNGGCRVKGQEAYAREEACANLLPLDLTYYPCCLSFFFALTNLWALNKICKLISTPVYNVKMQSKIYKLVAEKKHGRACFHLINCGIFLFFKCNLTNLWVVLKIFKMGIELTIAYYLVNGNAKGTFTKR